jgi:hypothetical protein
MSVRILGLRAGLNEQQKKADFFALIPDAEQIQQFLRARRPGSPLSHRYFFDDESSAASYVAGTGQREVCITVWGLERVQADEIEAVLKLNPGARFSMPAFQDIVEEVLHASVHAGRPRGTRLSQWYGEPAK